MSVMAADGFHAGLACIRIGASDLRASSTRARNGPGWVGPNLVAAM